MDAMKPLLAQLGGADAVARAVAMRRLEEEFGTAAQAPLLGVVREPGVLAARQDAAEVLARVATPSIVNAPR